MPQKLDATGKSTGSWRIVASAWLLAIILGALFVTVQAMASRHTPSPPRVDSLAGAVIPRHDPSFPGPDEVAASDWLKRAQAEAYSGW
jgi:hypothetical protein